MERGSNRVPKHMHESHYKKTILYGGNLYKTNQYANVIKFDQINDSI